jgi:hypothetical protein
MIAILIAIIFPVLFYCFVKIALSQQDGGDGEAIINEWPQVNSPNNFG